MKNPHSLIFLVFLSALAALPPFSIDMALPALRDIAAGLNTAPGNAGYTLTLFMAGFAATPVLYGPLSDRFGRKPVLIFAVALFTLGSVASTLSPSIGLLLLSRFLEGAGAGGGTALAFALVRDCFEGVEGRNKLAHVQMVMGLAPVVAPIIGGALLFLGWRSIYGVLALGGAALLATVVFSLHETHTTRDTSGSLYGGVVSGYATLLRHRAALGYALIYATTFGVQFSFISGSPLVFINHFGLSPQEFSGVFALCSAGIVAGASSNPVLARLGLSHDTVLSVALGLFVAAALVLWGLWLSGSATAVNFTVLLALSSFAYGLGASNASHGIMHALPEIAGIAGGVLATFQMSAAVLASFVVAVSYDALGVSAMIGPMLLFGLGSVALFVGLVKAPGLSHHTE